MSENKNRGKKTNKTPLGRLVMVFVLLVLVVISLVSTTFSSFVPENQDENNGSLIAQIKSAVVKRSKEDLADTKANVDLADTGYDLKCVFIYDNTYTKWSSVQILVGHNSWSEGYMMTQIANTNLWYYNMSSTWGGATHIAVFNASSKWEGEGNSVPHRVGYMDKNSSAKALSGNMTSGTQLLTSPTSATSSTDNFTLTTTYVSSYTGYNTVQTATVRSNKTGEWANDTNAGSTTISTYKLNSNTSSTSSTGTTSASAARSAAVTMVATAKDGYKFIGWYNSSGSLQTSNATFTYNCNGSAVTYYAYFEEDKYSYTVTAATGGTVSPTSGSVNAGSGVTITATPSAGYTFAEWTGLSKATLGSSTSASTTLTPTANGATVKANFRPDAPSALTLTGSNVAANTAGTGTQANPFIVFENSGFTLTAKATVVTGASARYSTTSTGTYNTTSTFNPPLTTKGTSQSYTVYSKAYVTNYYSTNAKSATAYYMVFSHLNGANTGFTMSSDSITDADTLTLSGAYVNGVADAEKAYITQTYQVSTDNSTFSDFAGSTWAPNEIGTYYFRVKTENTKTGEIVYSTSQRLTVIQSTVYYDIKVVNDGTVNGTVALKADGVAITDNRILSNSKLIVSLKRPNSNYYIEYLEVDTITESDNMNVNGDISDYVAYDHIKGNVEIHYKLALKPTVTVYKPTNADSISFKYYSDGKITTVTSAGKYYVDYGSNITYTVTPKSGYYVSAMTGVTIGNIKEGAVDGTKNNVTANISSVTATLSNNKTVTVSVDSTSDVTNGGSMTIDGVALGFGQPKPLNYGATSTIVITPPEGCFAVVSGNNVNATIDTDGKATFDVTLTGANKNYKVKFVNNPTISMVQPQYGSIYVTSGTENNTQYYFNGDSVGYGTELTVHVKPDHANAILSEVLVNDSFIGETDGSTFNIVEDSTASAKITIKSDHEFNDNTEYGTRRIFFTDNSGWGDGNVMVHYSNTDNDINFTDGNTKAMTYKFTNDSNQRVYYADIPYNFKYVNFYKKSATSNYTASALINNEANAFWHNGGNSPCGINTWQENYSDFVAADRETSIQQATTVKDEAAVFEYTCDFGDDALEYELVNGNAVTVEFDKGVLYITPTDNSQPHALVKVTSKASTTVKYYLIRVENFEIVSFSGLQKIYNSQVFNDIQLDLIVKGGVLNYAAKLFSSPSNFSGSYEEITDARSSGFEENKTIQAYINSFLLEYQINSLSGVKYYKVEANDGANRKATSTLKTLFGTNTYSGERCVYFYNNSGVDISKYAVRSCFNNASNTEHSFVTMQRVGDTNYYRAVVPNGYENTVNFYLANPKTFSNNFADYDGKDDTVEVYNYGILNEVLPQTDNANIVYTANGFGSSGIEGYFAQFDY